MLRATLAAGEIIRLFTRNMDRQKLLNLIQKTELKLIVDETKGFRRCPRSSIWQSQRRIIRDEEVTMGRSSPLILGKILEALGLRGSRVILVSLGFDDIARLNVEVAVCGRQPIGNLIGGEGADVSDRSVE